jgi:hypothetical protein
VKWTHIMQRYTNGRECWQYATGQPWIRAACAHFSARPLRLQRPVHQRRGRLSSAAHGLSPASRHYLALAITGRCRAVELGQRRSSSSCASTHVRGACTLVFQWPISIGAVSVCTLAPQVWHKTQVISNVDGRRKLRVHMYKKR